MTQKETQFFNGLQQIVDAVFNLMSSLTFNYQTGNCVLSTAGISTADLQAAKAKLQGYGFTATLNAGAQTATVHSDFLVNAAANLTMAQFQEAKNYLTDLGYIVTLDTNAKTVTLEWDNRT